jgi:hypothetical protein
MSGTAATARGETRVQVVLLAPAVPADRRVASWATKGDNGTAVRRIERY